MSALVSVLVGALAIGATPNDGSSPTAEPTLRLTAPEVVFRGQSDPFAPPLTAPQPAPFAPTTPYPMDSGTGIQDPFLAPAQPYPPADPYGGYYGVNGPQPYRLGLVPRFEVGFLPSSNTSDPNVGSFQVTEIEGEIANSRPVFGDWIFTHTPQAGLRLWEGPDLIDLPPTVYRLGWNLELATGQRGPWSFQASFNPSINTDFDHQLTSDAWNLDAQASATYRVNPELMLVGGIFFWDRVDEILLPMGGVVWNPNDRWELRLTFPKARISYFVGNLFNEAHWLYGTAEYHVESYQISSPTIDVNQVQLQDIRVMLGLRSEGAFYTKFIEAGAVLNRDVEFRNIVPDFTVDDGFIVRAGVRF